jgi:hypothetical protein
MSEQLSQKIISNLNIPEFYVVFGGLPDQTDADAFEPVGDSLVARRAGISEKALIADNNEWQYGKRYNAWMPGVTGNYYAFNPSNRTVYLCTENTENNRLDEDVALSTVIPSHIEPQIQNYEDGYSWIPLFKVDVSQIEFLSQTDLPIPDLQKSQSYTTFTEKYEDLCGSGVTSFGCCCLYFKDNSVDEITGEVYTAGDLTNETIFSDCYECQKIAEALDREVTFLSGYTAGSITSSSTGENPLCPATKTIKTLQEQLDEEKYTLVPGSSREYALYLLNNFQNENGILSATIDLAGVTTSVKTVTTANPEITIKDPTGTNARVRLLTEQTGDNKYEVYGVELLDSGSGYSALPDWSLANTTVDNYIKLVRFPDNFYTDPTTLVPGDRYRIKVRVTSSQLADNVNVEEITKIAVLTDPKLTDSQAVAEKPTANVDLIPLQTNVFAGRGPELAP